MQTAIERAIHHALAQHPELPVDAIRVRVDGTTVTLSGYVRTWEEKIAVFEVVTSVPGVKAIYDTIATSSRRQCPTSFRDGQEAVSEMPIEQSVS